MARVCTALLLHADGAESSPEALSQDEDNDESLDAEGFLERERRWLEGVFAASNLGDLSCLFRDAGSKFNPDEFFPMVLNERVAWVEFMELARAALFKQADATATGVQADAANSRGRGVGVVAEGGGGTSGGRRYSNGSSSGSSSGDGSNNAAAAVAIKSDAVLEDRSNAHNSHNNNNKNNNGIREEDNAKKKTPTITTNTIHQQRHHHSTSTPSGATTTKHIRPLTIGRSVRETSATDAWTVFKFYLPTAGPVLTVVLDALDGHPELFVSRGRLPSLMGINDDVEMAAVSTDDDGEGAGGVSTPGDGGSDWQASRTPGTLRVVKIFPHDPK